MLADTVEVMLPLEFDEPDEFPANQFHEAYVCEFSFTAPFEPTVKPSLSKEAKLSAVVASALVALDSNSFVAPLTVSKSLCGDVELRSLIQVQSGANPTPVIACPPLPIAVPLPE